MTAKELEDLRQWHATWEAMPKPAQLRREAQARLRAKIAARRVKLPPLPRMQ